MWDKWNHSTLGVVVIMVNFFLSLIAFTRVSHVPTMCPSRIHLSAFHAFLSIETCHIYMGIIAAYVDDGTLADPKFCHLR